MALFNSLLDHDETTKIVDVGHRFYHDFLNTIDEIGFMEEVAEADRVQPVFVFHAVGTQTSLHESLSLAKRWPNACRVVVLNRGAMASEAKLADIAPELPHTKRISIGALDSVARSCFESVDFSLTNFARTPPPELSFVTHMALRVWAKAIFDQFRRFEIGMALQGRRHL